MQKYKVLHFTKIDTRLANNELPTEVQRLRCRVNYGALRFAAPIVELGKKIVGLLRQKGPFLALHLICENGHDCFFWLHKRMFTRRG